MSDASVTATLVDKWDDGQRLHVIASIAIDASPDTYPTGGLSADLLSVLSDSRPGFVALPGISQQPTFVRIEGIAGYKYEYDLTNKKILIRSSAAVAAHSHDLKVIGGQAATTTNELGHYATDILGKEAATDATILGADSATKGGVLSANAIAAAALGELANGSAIPAGVSGDTIQLYAIFKKNQ